VGTLATSKYDEKTSVFSKVHASSAAKSNVLPLTNYYGKKPDPNKDPYDRRVTQQLNDIDFSEDDEDDFEDVKNIKRQPKTVLTEENLKKILSEETLKLNLEHHYWLKDSFLSKIGRMAPHLQELSLRRLKLSDDSAFELFSNLKFVRKVDISEC